VNHLRSQIKKLHHVKDTKIFMGRPHRLSFENIPAVSLSFSFSAVNPPKIFVGNRKPKCGTTAYQTPRNVLADKNYEFYRFSIRFLLATTGFAVRVIQTPNEQTPDNNVLQEARERFPLTIGRTSVERGLVFLRFVVRN